MQSIYLFSLCLWQASQTVVAHKPTKYFAPHNPTEPGQLVAVDILTSPTPGFIAQMSGILTCVRYMHAEVYVDVATGYGYIHLQQSVCEEEKLTGKHTFERHCQKLNVMVKTYHSDDGIFNCNAWQNSCNTQFQGLSFAAAGAYHQNGVSERRIRMRVWHGLCLFMLILVGPKP
jgi:hypothetical protein